MNRRLFSLACITQVALMLSSEAVAQAPRSWVELPATRTNQVALAAFADASSRVGSAALIRVFWKKTSSDTAYVDRLLLACNGSWISTPIQSTMHDSPRWLSLDLYRSAQREEEPNPLSPIEIEPTDTTPYPFINLLRPRARDICRTAGIEPKNVQVPLAEGTDQFGTFVTALLLGTSAKQDSRLIVWTRTSWFTTVQLRGRDGIPYVIDGAPVTKRQSTGFYRLDRRAFDCEKKEVATLETVDYLPGKVVPDRATVAPTDLSFSAVIPGSVGQGLLSAVCALYGQSS